MFLIFTIEHDVFKMSVLTTSESSCISHIILYDIQLKSHVKKPGACKSFLTRTRCCGPCGVQEVRFLHDARVPRARAVILRLLNKHPAELVLLRAPISVVHGLDLPVSQIVTEM